MSAPTTEAGRALLDRWYGRPDPFGPAPLNRTIEEAILAIEAEARSAARIAELALDPAYTALLAECDAATARAERAEQACNEAMELLRRATDAAEEGTAQWADWKARAERAEAMSDRALTAARRAALAALHAQPVDGDRSGTT